MRKKLILRPEKVTMGRNYKYNNSSGYKSSSRKETLSSKILSSPQLELTHKSYRGEDGNKNPPNMFRTTRSPRRIKRSPIKNTQKKNNRNKVMKLSAYN